MKLNKIQENNIKASEKIHEIVATSLGPLGMKKLFYNQHGDFFLIDDGKTILEKFDYKHPVSKLLLDLAKKIRLNDGDGTTSAILISSKLVENAKNLMESGIHPSLIIQYYNSAFGIIEKKLKNISKKIDQEKHPYDQYFLETNNSTKFSKLEKTVVNNIIKVHDKKGKNRELEINIISAEDYKTNKIKKIKGIIFDSEKLTHDMSKTIKNARIGIVESISILKRSNLDYEISISRPTESNSFKKFEENYLKTMIDDLKRNRINVLFTHKTIDPSVSSILARNNIFAIRRIPMKTLNQITKLTGATFVLNTKELNESTIGTVETIVERKIGRKTWIHVDSKTNHSVFTLAIFSSLQRRANQIEDNVRSLCVYMDNYKKKSNFVPGGGAAEIAISTYLKQEAMKIKTKEQLAHIAFAESLESIPNTLLKNADMYSIENISKLGRFHKSRKNSYGINHKDRKIKDMWKIGIIEPVDLKISIIEKALKTANIILEIDDSHEKLPVQKMPNKN